MTLGAPLQRPPRRVLGLRDLARPPVGLVSSATKSARQLGTRLGPECVGVLRESTLTASSRRRAQPCRPRSRLQKARHTIKPNLSLCGALAAALLAGGCFGSTPKNEYYYYLTGPKGHPKTAQKGATLAVDDFNVAPGYSRQVMAYKTQENELRYYGYRRWVSPPAKLLQAMTMRHLRASGNFAQVETEDKLRDPLALMQATVDALEELDKGDKTYARLAMRIVIRDASSQRVLFHHDFDKTFPCTKRHPREVAHGVSKILELEMRQLATRIADVLK